jgi:hypothetical protein
MADRGGYGIQDLASKMLQIQAKKFFLDVKENRRGRFIKMSEVGATGHKNRLILDMSAASEFHEQLTNFIEHYSSLGPRIRNAWGDDKIKSEVIHAGERRYYLDLKENSRGRFLKVSMTMPPPSMDRQQIVIPAQGMSDIRDALTDLLSEFATSSRTADEPEDKLSLKVCSKAFFFDIGENKHGEYLRISEVSPSFQTAINIPCQIWNVFREKLHALLTEASASTNSHVGETDFHTDLQCSNDINNVVDINESYSTDPST